MRGVGGGSGVSVGWGGSCGGAALSSIGDFAAFKKCRSQVTQGGNLNAAHN